MDKILNIGLAKGTTDVVLEIERTRRDGTVWTETVQIEPHELINMTDDTQSYPLKHQTRPFKPKYVEDFDYYQCEYMRTLYKNCLISLKEYTTFCRARLEASLKRRFPQPSSYPVYIDPDTGAMHEETSSFAEKAFQKRMEFCVSFFRFSLPTAVLEKYENNPFRMVTAHQRAVNEKQELPLYFTRVGGTHIGFYTDDLDRVRPLTSRKKDVLEFYPDCLLEQFQIAFQEELDLLEAEAECTTN